MDLSHIDMSNVHDKSFMLLGCSSVKKLVLPATCKMLKGFSLPKQNWSCVDAQGTDRGTLTSAELAIRYDAWGGTYTKQS